MRQLSVLVFPRHPASTFRPCAIVPWSTEILQTAERFLSTNSSMPKCMICCEIFGCQGLCQTAEKFFQQIRQSMTGTVNGWRRQHLINDCWLPTFMHREMCPSNYPLFCSIIPSFSWEGDSFEVTGREPFDNSAAQAQIWRIIAQFFESRLLRLYGCDDGVIKDSLL